MASLNDDDQRRRGPLDLRGARAFVCLALAGGVLGCSASDSQPVQDGGAWTSGADAGAAPVTADAAGASARPTEAPDAPAVDAATPASATMPDASAPADLARVDASTGGDVGGGAGDLRATDGSMTSADGAGATNAGALINDPLLGSTKGTMTGGMVTAEGYMPGKGYVAGRGCSHIRYDLPTTVRNGRITFEVKGMVSYSSDLEHGFLGMYDGRGVKEPAVYAPDFKQNYYRWNVHYRGDQKAMKCVLTLARPDRVSAARAVFPGDSPADRDFSTEPTGGNITFDPARWHKFVVEWRARTFSVTIDGAEKWKAVAFLDRVQLVGEIRDPRGEECQVFLVPLVRLARASLVSHVVVPARPVTQEARIVVARTTDLHRSDADLVALERRGQDVEIGGDRLVHLICVAGRRRARVNRGHCAAATGVAGRGGAGRGQAGRGAGRRRRSGHGTAYLLKRGNMKV
jgi:hypothetical protein